MQEETSGKCQICEENLPAGDRVHCPRCGGAMHRECRDALHGCRDLACHRSPAGDLAPLDEVVAHRLRLYTGIHYQMENLCRFGAAFILLALGGLGGWGLGVTKVMLAIVPIAAVAMFLVLPVRALGAATRGLDGAAWREVLESGIGRYGAPRAQSLRTPFWGSLLPTTGGLFLWGLVLQMYDPLSGVLALGIGAITFLVGIFMIQHHDPGAPFFLDGVTDPEIEAALAHAAAHPPKLEPEKAPRSR